MNMRYYSTLHLDTNLSKGTVLLLQFYVLHITVTVGFSTNCITHTLKWFILLTNIWAIQNKVRWNILTKFLPGGIKWNNLYVSNNEWLLFNAKSAIFQLCHGEDKLNWMRWQWCPLCARPTCLVGFL